MKITAIYHQGIPAHPQFQEILQIITSTLEELEISLELIDLAAKSLPYYIGKKTGKMDEIIEKVQKSQAVLLGICTNQGSIGGPMEVFLDHCKDPSYQPSFQDKPLFSLLLSKDWGEKQAAAYLTARWDNLQGTQGEQIIGSLPQMALWNTAWTSTIERKTEDFYRSLRQNRTILPTSQGPNQITKTIVGKHMDFSGMPQQPTGLSTGLLENTPFQETLSQALEEKTKDPEQIATSGLLGINFEQFNQQQEDDIQEITMLLKQQLNPVPKPTTLTAKQKTMSLPHHFQPHLVGDTQIQIQLQIQGADPFQVTIQIDGVDCQVEEGSVEEADLTLHVGEDTWKDILKGKISYQKAFMTGQMKVKGNFIYLNKLEQWFTKMS